MPFKRLFKDKHADSSPENASVVRTLFNLFIGKKLKEQMIQKDGTKSPIGIYLS